jgi:hypothetical protein
MIPLEGVKWDGAVLSTAGSVRQGAALVLLSSTVCHRVCQVDNDWSGVWGSI